VKTEPLSPAKILMMPQRLSVPLFQRPYVWNKIEQWEPLWRDVTRVTDRLLDNPTGTHQPHFLGAVVFQQVQHPTGDLQERTVIDGQQRLTTLQLMFDAIHSQFVAVGAKIPASKLLKLVENDEDYRTKFEDKFKVWPTNKDRPAFNEVMDAEAPIDYSSLEFKNSKLTLCHKYFSDNCQTWLTANGPDEINKRAEALGTAVRELLQIVVIDLEATEDAQEIFETLNARGAALTSADLIKNFVFQRLQESNTDVENAYESYWKDFESPFWEESVNYGRFNFQRTSLFIYQWLVSKTGEEILMREVFSRFKHFADYEFQKPMLTMLEEMHACATEYAKLMVEADSEEGNISELAMFSYRLRCLELDVLRPILVTLIDPSEVQIAYEQVSKTTNSLESWAVRRLICGLSNKNYNKLVPEIINLIRNNRENCGNAIEKFLVNQNVASSYWPDNAQVSQEFIELPVYRKLYKSRIRMILEAIEDDKRGWNNTKGSKTGTRVKRSTFSIEHLLPQTWGANWPLPNGLSEEEREKSLHKFGNLTLVTGKLNSTLSNGPWPAKLDALLRHDVLIVNTELHTLGESGWDEEKISLRSVQLLSHFMSIWPTPEGHKVKLAEKPRRIEINVSDLISSGLVTPGQVLYTRNKARTNQTATILDGGQIQVDEKVFESLSLAAMEALNRISANGWRAWLVSRDPLKSMSDVRDEYRESLGLESSEDETEEGDD
jgi:hypothetical protein